jgi:hypothetical protein
MDKTDEQIISSLQYGKKRQSEIIELVNKGQTSVRNKLDQLVEQGAIEEEQSGNQKYYYLPGSEKIVPPKPPASDDQVEKCLYSLAAGLEIFTGSDIINNNLGTQGQSIELPPAVASAGFMSIANQRYFVLSNSPNTKLFFELLDFLLDNDKLCQTPRTEIRTTASIPGVDHLDKQLSVRLSHVSFFNAIQYIYSNYEKGKEVDEIRSELIDRSDKMMRFIPNEYVLESDFTSGVSHEPSDKITSDPVYRALGTVLKLIDVEKYREFLERRMLTGNYETEPMIVELFEAYDQNNDIDDLLAKIESIKGRTGNEQKSELENLESKLKRRYRVDCTESSEGRAVPREAIEFHTKN